MKDVDLYYLCTAIGNLAGIPIRVFKGNQQVFFHANFKLPKDPLIVYQDEIFQITDHVGYFSTKHFNYYGIVTSGDTRIVLGPTRQVSCSEQELRELAFRADVASEDVEIFISGMKSIVPMPLTSIMQILCTINYILNQEKLELKDIIIYEEKQPSIKETSIASPTPLHNTYDLEQMIMEIIRKGDSSVLQKWIHSAPAVNGGLLASDQLRQLKNTFIVTATLASRAAIQGGMEVEDAFSLSDSYIQQCELLNTPERITTLQYHMILQFTERVERIRILRRPSKLTIDVANYVQHHLSESIRAEDIAKELFLSRPYLSAKFRAETGMTLTDFILNEKTEEAKRLLRYTDKTVTVIGSYLGFSSHSHFTRVFKKYAHMTPNEYREKYA